MDQYIGKLLDNRYEILDVIGVGGMAMVYKAYCHRLHRFVAVKILRNDLAYDSDFRKRFHDEAQAVAMLSHPNIVSVYDVSRSEELDYIVMELIDGITLKQYMKRKGGALSWREALHYITQIMRSLSHAHSRGIIHRDIKPQNIMVLRDGSVRVMDFGIARVMSAAQNTLTQEALGSVHYISPEQARGSHIDERADIYSAGVVLYEMLTGRLPFEGDSPVSVAIQHISSIPLSPRELNPDIPEALESITLKAMSSDVDRRYKNAEDMIKDLEEFRKNPNVNFEYDHSILLQSDEPTQVIDTSSIERERQNQRPTATRVQQNPKQAAKPVPKTKPKPKEDFEYEIIDDYDEARGRGTSRREKNQKSSLIPVIAVVAVFVVGVAVFLWMTFFSNLFKQVDTVTIPDFRGMTIAQAEILASEEQYGGRFVIIEDGSVESDDYDAGQIVSQSPSANSTQKGEEIEITVIVSSGVGTISMPDVVNKSYTEARLELEAAGLVVREPKWESSDEVVMNYVISSMPEAGTTVTPGESVQLVVSQGTDSKLVVVPTLTGRTRSQAETMLSSLNLVGNFVDINSDEPVGMIIYQSALVNTEVEEGSQITLHVSIGPEVPVEPVPPVTEPEQKSQFITIPLPDDRDRVTVSVTVDGVEKFSGSVNISTTDGTITQRIDGSGVQEVTIYFDGVWADSYTLNFDEE